MTPHGAQRTDPVAPVRRYLPAFLSFHVSTVHPMSSDDEAPLVAGRPVITLGAACATFESVCRGEMVDMECRLDPERVIPFLRSLMRLEAELLLDDSNSYG